MLVYKMDFDIMIIDHKGAIVVMPNKAVTLLHHKQLAI